MWSVIITLLLFALKEQDYWLLFIYCLVLIICFWFHYWHMFMFINLKFKFMMIISYVLEEIFWLFSILIVPRPGLTYLIKGSQLVYIFLLTIYGSNTFFTYLVEPFYGTICLYNRERREKLSEDLYFHVLPTELQDVSSESIMGYLLVLHFFGALGSAFAFIVLLWP